MARIVHVSATLATGIYTIICTLAKCQLEKGHEVFLVGCTRPSDSVANWRDDLPAGVQFIELPMEREIALRQDLAAAKRLRAILQEIRPDVIHLHSSKAGAVGRVAALGIGAKVVYQPNGFAFLRRDVSKGKAAFFGFVESLLALLPGRIVASSEGERSAAKKYFWFRKLDVVPNSIELPAEIHAIRSSRFSNDVIKIGTCGRVSPQKDPQFFSNVAQQIHGRVQFTWIGGGDYPQGHEHLAAVAADVTGVVSRDEATRKIADLDIYIQTSAWEGMPISVLEAMALGVPVVVRDVVGNRDLLEHVTPELIVSTPSQMAEAVLKVADDSNYRNEISTKLRSFVRERFSPSAQASAFERLYHL